MDGRGGIPRPGLSPPYYIHMSFSPPGGGSHPSFQGPPPGMRSITSPGANFPPPSTSIGAAGDDDGSAFHGDATDCLSPATGGNAGVHSGGAVSGEAVKRKRGRPRKYGPDGVAALLGGASPLSPSAPGTGSAEGSGPTEKRVRGRPPGSGKNQQLASLGGWVSSSAGKGFTPHIITIPQGEDVAAKLVFHSQEGSRSTCILSASGFVSRVILRRPSTPGDTASYEGRFEILCLSGSFVLTEDGGSNKRSGGISVSLSTPDGRVFGGGVEQLIADSPVQVMVGSFNYSTKAKSKSVAVAGPPNPGGEADHTRDAEQMTPSLPNQNFNPVWSSSRQMNIRNAPLDIDLTRVSASQHAPSQCWDACLSGI